jgi:hypothetical protein
MIGDYRRLTPIVKKFSRRTLALSALLGLLFFIVSGYLLSDAFFFKRLVYQNNITSPEGAFTIVSTNTGVPDPRNFPPLEYSPMLMLTEQKDLFCDQSAILMATIVGELGYDARLVDWVGDDGVSHHTILEVKQNGGWKAYDTLNRLQGETYEQIQRRLSYDARPVYRTHVGSRWITRHNYYLQRLSLWLKSWK